MKKRLYIWIVCCFLPLTLMSNDKQNTVRMVIPKTPISLIPPANFVVSDFYDGFLHKATSSSITGKIEAGKGYVEFNKRFTAEYLTAIGLNLIKKEDIKTNEMEGTLYLVSFVVRNTNMQRYMLVTGDHQNTYFVMANFAVGFKEQMSEPIKRSLMTVQYK